MPVVSTSASSSWYSTDQYMARNKQVQKAHYSRMLREIEAEQFEEGRTSQNFEQRLSSKLGSCRQEQLLVAWTCFRCSHILSDILGIT